MARFELEVAAWMELSHPNVCALLGVLSPQGGQVPVRAMALEFMPGTRRALAVNAASAMPGGSLDQLLHRQV